MKLHLSYVPACLVFAALGCAQSGDKSTPPMSVTARDTLNAHIPAALATLRFERDGAMFAPKFATQIDTKSAVVARLPVAANGAVLLSHGSQKLSVVLQGATDAAARADSGHLQYPGALGEGTTVTQRVTPSGTEDFIRFESAPTKTELRYSVSLDEGVAGLRLVANTLEFLDAEGTPQMHVSPPYGIDANGTRFDAQLSVEGANVDTDARAPWGRAVVAPGARNIVVAVRWNAHVQYPAIIDPSWATAGDTASPSSTWETFALKLSSGRVLYLGAASASAELFDPATGTWAATGAMPFAFNHRQRAAAGSGGLAWTISANGTYQTAAYDEAVGTWTSKASLPGPAQDGQNGYALTHLGGNKFFFASGNNGSTFIYDLAANTYTQRASLTAYNSYNNAGAYLLSDGRVLAQFADVNKLSIFNVAANTWTYTAADTGAGSTNCAPVVELSNGKWLWYGAGGSNPNWARIYDPATNTFSAPTAFPTSPTMSHPCNGPNNFVSYGSKHLVAGGRFQFDEATNSATLTPAFASGVPYHEAIVRLNDGRALAVAGSNTIGHNNKTDIWSPSAQADCDAPPFGTTTTPVFNATTKRCVACTGDNGTGGAAACPSTAMPICAASGACVACSATNTSACTGTTPTCNAAVGTCTGANGDFGSTTATQACPSSSAPFALASGACGLCADEGTGANGCGNASPVHAGPFCNVSTGACSNTCGRDAQCGTSWCATDTGACTTKLANGVSIPTVAGRNTADPALSGLCTTAVGTAICESGVCSTSNNKCGYAAGEGSCTSANAAAVCQSGLCSAAGVCSAASSCFGDGDCSGGWCLLSGNQCQGKLANGAAMPNDPTHANPALTGSCTTAAAALVCVAGVCETSDNKCGLANGSACTSGTASACRAAVCGSDSKCGYVDGEGSCTAANAASVCRNGKCRTDGKCGTDSVADAGAPDAGPADAGKIDAGSTADGGAITDAGGNADAGGKTDGGGAATDNSTESGGCGCDVAGGNPLGIWAAGAVAVMLLGRRRRAATTTR